MDLEQKSTGAIKFEISEWFFEKLMILEDESKEGIINDIESIASKLPDTDGDYEQVYGVVYSDELFYVLEYSKVSGEVPIIFYIDFVESDEYLDAINKNKTIKDYERH